MSSPYRPFVLFLSRRYYSEKLKQARFAINEEELRQYFPLPTVLQGLFSLAEDMFDVQITRVPTHTAHASNTGDDSSGNDSVPVWHPDVEFFQVSTQTGKPIITVIILKVKN